MKFRCPSCHSSLKSSEDEVGETDRCPDCQQRFKLSSAAIAAVKKLRDEQSRVKERDALRAEVEALKAEIEKMRAARTRDTMPNPAPQPRPIASITESIDDETRFHSITVWIDRSKSIHTFETGVPRLTILNSTDKIFDRLAFAQDRQRTATVVVEHMSVVDAEDVIHRR